MPTFHFQNYSGYWYRKWLDESSWPRKIRLVSLLSWTARQGMMPDVTFILNFDHFGLRMVTLTSGCSTSMKNWTGSTRESWRWSEKGTGSPPGKRQMSSSTSSWPHSTTATCTTCPRTSTGPQPWTSGAGWTLRPPGRRSTWATSSSATASRCTWPWSRIPCAQSSRC